MNAAQLKTRTKRFGLQTIRLVQSLPRTQSANVIGTELLRSGTSVGANYRSACRARSKPEFISKSSVALDEADESVYWMELLIEGGLAPAADLNILIKEGNELVAILTASVRTARANLK